MSKYITVHVIVEGRTEYIFVQQILFQYLNAKGISIIPIIASKPGEKGGDIKFQRVEDDIVKSLRQKKCKDCIYICRLLWNKRMARNK